MKREHDTKEWARIRIMVFNATFNNISVISWRLRRMREIYIVYAIAKWKFISKVKILSIYDKCRVRDKNINTQVIEILNIHLR